jgi:hypothetical protein
MKLVCSKLAAFAIAFAALINSASSEPVTAGFITQRIYTSPSSGVSKDVYVHDSVGLYVGNFIANGYGYDDGYGQVFTDLSLSITLPPGVYSFALQGDDYYYYWTGMFTVVSGSGFSGGFGSEAFSQTEAPTDPPDTITGNFLVEGSIEMQGRLFNIGTNPVFPDQPAFSLMIDGGYTQRNIATYPSLANWTWEAPSLGSTMTLSLTSGNAILRLNGAQVLTTAHAGSQFLQVQPPKLAVGSSVLANGTNAAAFGVGTTAQGRNQFVVGQYNTPISTSANNNAPGDALFIVGNGTGLTAGLQSNAFVVSRNGDAQIAGKLIAGINASAADDAVAAIGAEASAYGYGSLALGQFAVAEAYTSIAMGQEAVAFAGNSLAIGTGAVAGGVGSLTIGSYNQTWGDYSIAAGWASSANGRGSIALGEMVLANAKNQVVLGRYNAPSGSPSVEAPTDAVLIVGNGTDNLNRSNALTVRRDTGTAIGKGVESAREAQVVVGKFNDTRNNDNGTDHTQGIFVVGNGTSTAQAARKNAMRVVEQNGQSLVLIQKAGDISMGEFEAGPRP